MSINHLTNPDINPKLDIYCKNLNSIGDADIGVIKDLKFKAVDESVIHASSLINQGDPGQVLTSSGDGSLYWSTGGGGGSGIEYTGTQPVLLNSLSKYNSLDGSTVSKTNFTDTDILLKDGSVQMTGSLNLAGNSIDNNLVLNTSVLAANLSESPIITVNNTLNMANSSVVNCFRVTTDSLQSQAVGGNITCLSNLEMKNDDILNCNLGEIATLDTSSIKNTNSPNIICLSNLDMQNNDISDINLLNDVTTAVIDTVITTSITSGSTEILFGKNLNLENNEITNVTNIKTLDINTNTISAISPAQSVKLTTDLDLDGNNIIGLTTLNGIQASGGVYSNTGGFNFSGATPTTNLLTFGTSYGSTDIDSDVFKAGDIYTLKIGGQLTCDNNDIFNIAIVSNFGLGSECVFSNFSVSIDGAKLNDFWEIEIDFSVRNIGVAGVASITTNGDFTYFNSTNVKKGYGISGIQNTTFDTTINNNLAITYSTTETSITNFQIDQASLMKFF